MTAPAAIVMPLTPTAAGKKATASASRVAVSEIRRLTSAMKNGDELAFREFHAAYFNRLLRYLFVVTRGDEEAARDALQETFTRVVRHVRPFDAQEDFWNWLTVLARSAATDAGRKRTRYWRMLARYAFFWRTAGEGADGDGDGDLEALLGPAMETLGAADRALLEGKYFRGATVRALAAEFQLSEKAVESRLARARRQLREELCQRLRDEKAK